ncbi:MAG: HAMP domain-containing protein [Burkholderiales bacterium]|nr:HAMP domain-containing protein [Phycisphaerae bacterium]
MPRTYIQPQDTQPDEVSALDRIGNKRRFGGGFYRLSLQSKLVFSFVLIVIAALAGFTAITLAASQHRMTRSLIGQSNQASLALASLAPQSLVNRDHAMLQSVADRMVGMHESLVEVTFYDAAGAPVAHTSATSEKPRKLDPSDTVRIGPIEQTDAQLGGVTPILDTVTRTILGYVRVAVSLEQYHQQVEHMTHTASKIGIAFAVCSAAVAWILIRRFLLPIRSLVFAAKQIAAGDLETRVETYRPDSIGDLARAFNEMTRTVKQQQNALRRANKELANANRDLESKVDQRTQQFETANRRLSAEIAEKEDFLRAVSHDLNAPLRNISGMVTMILMKKKDVLDADVLQRLDRIKKNVEIETDLINELLELSHIKSRRQVMEQVDLEAMIWELRGLFENDLKTRPIELVVDTLLPALYCEKARLRQVFQNLIDNAIKYMGDGDSKQIHIGCQIRLSEAEFYVRDTGMGMDEEDVSKVFFVFRRGKNVAANNIAGKGVGLASVKSIVETYSGKIWVESEVGKGSTFRFTINGQYVPATGGFIRASENSAGQAVAA